MTEAGERLIEAAKEALAVAAGEQPAYRLHIDGHTYAPVGELIALDARCNDLRAKAQHLVDCLDDADRNHGGLVGGVTMRAANELRQELLKWKAK